ncbi:MAG: NAD-dependent epimerase/dehydratase family protein [Woeseia sp.]
MNKQRRRLVQASLLGGAVAAGGLLPACAEQQEASAPKPLSPKRQPAMRILVLGGTGYIGPHMVREALLRGHTVELFNRGRTNDELFPDLKTYVGDRNNGLAPLADGKWDVIIDNSGYVPRHVADSAKLLSSRASHYIFISSISAYADFGSPLDEDSPLASIADETVEEVTNETYGPLKALCEKRAAQEFGADRLAVLRPTYICGPGDRTDRYTYWPVRTMRGGEMLWPGTANDDIQIIDVRDLANFVIDVAEKRISGIYNTVTPAGSFTMGQLQQDCLAVTASDMTPVWVDYEFLKASGVTETGELPIWVAPQSAEAYVAKVSGERAAAQGLVTRPPRETARDTISWWATLPAERTATLRAGLKPEREAELLASWKSRQS